MLFSDQYLILNSRYCVKLEQWVEVFVEPINFDDNDLLRYHPSHGLSQFSKPSHSKDHIIAQFSFNPPCMTSSLGEINLGNVPLLTILVGTAVFKSTVSY